MKILITGATSVIGRVAAAQLLAAGHRVAGVAQQSHPCLDPRVDLVCAPLSDPVLQELADASDAVIHLAPIEPGVPESAGIAGVVHVTHAASRAGARLLFLSHAAGDPVLYRQAEELVASCFSPSLVIRAAPPVGRHADWMVCRTVATLLTADLVAPVRLLHTDDLHRFLVRSVGSHRTGTVDLATADAVSPMSARRRLDSVGKIRRLATWPVPEPELNIVPLQQEWEFECGWTAAIAVADMGQALAGRRLGATGAIDIAGKLALPVEVTPRDVAAGGSGLHKAAQDGVAGEFDDLIDPRYPKFSALCTSDALPGPLTPMTLDLHLAGLRAAHQATAELLGLPAVLAHEWERRGVAVFAHRLFTAVSTGDLVSAKVPGGDRRRLLASPTADAVVAARVMGVSRRYGSWCEDYPKSARELGVEGYAGLSDATLETRIKLLRNIIHRGWTLSTVGTLMEGMLMRAGRREHRVLPLLAATTSTGQLAAETAAFAEILRTDQRLCDLAAAGDLTLIDAEFPAAAATFEAALARVGHRGPGEAELANPVIADSPGQLLAAAALAADIPMPPPVAEPRTTAVLRRADNIRLLREGAWDTTLRFTHQMRIALRERGSRLTAKRVIATADDIFYLTVDEALAPPVDTRLRVNRRRAERERLQSINMPDIVDGQWTALPDSGAPEGASVASTERDLEPQGQV